MKLAPLMLAASCLVFAGWANAQSGDDLLKSKGCMGCHDLDKKKVGPSFKDLTAKYNGNKDGAANVIKALKEGKGHPMKVSASDADLKTMVERVLSQK